MAADIGRHVEEIVLAALPPDTVLVAVLDTLLEELGDLALGGGAAAPGVLADALAEQTLVVAFLARLPQVGGPADGRRVFDLAGHAQGVAVDQGDVAVGCARAGEVAFQLGVARRRVRGGADEHGAPCVVVMRHADLFAAGSESACGRPPRAGVGVVPVRVVGGECEAFLRGCGRDTLIVVHGVAWVDHCGSRLGMRGTLPINDTVVLWNRVGECAWA